MQGKCDDWVKVVGGVPDGSRQGLTCGKQSQAVGRLSLSKQQGRWVQRMRRAWKKVLSVTVTDDSDLGHRQRFNVRCSTVNTALEWLFPSPSPCLSTTIHRIIWSLEVEVLTISLFLPRPNEGRPPPYLEPLFVLAHLCVQVCQIYPKISAMPSLTLRFPFRMPMIQCTKCSRRFRNKVASSVIKTLSTNTIRGSMSQSLNSNRVITHFSPVFARLMSFFYATDKPNFHPFQ